MDTKLIASSSPHVRSSETITKIMMNVLIALLPATLASIYFFRFDAIKLIVLGIGSAVLTEFIIQKLSKKTVKINDLSAVLTGLLLAFNLPPTAPWWIPVIGSAFAIAIVKEAFGGLGHNFMNPALAARAMLVASWPVIMTNWANPVGVDATTTATPLAIMGGDVTDAILPPLKNLFLGNIGGTIGETSALLLILGGIWLLYKKVINWRIPTAYIGTVAVMAFLFDGGLTGMGYHVFAGGLMLGAFFMATDYVTSPVTPKGQIIFGIGAGILTITIRLFGGYPEGVSYSILLMNVASPIIERYTSPKVFGGVKKNA